MKSTVPPSAYFSHVLKLLFSRSPLSRLETKGRHYTTLLERHYGGPQKYLELSCGRVCYVEKGSGKPIILLHGLGANISRWNLTLEALAKHYWVIAYDHPGFGKSDKPLREYTVPWLSHILTEFIEKMGLQIFLCFQQ